MRIEDQTVLCNLYTPDRVVKMAISKADYNSLLRDGFFIRSGKTADSAGVLNTTRAYQLPERKAV